MGLQTDIAGLSELNMQNTQHNVIPASGLTGCVGTAGVAALPSAVFPPAEAIPVPRSCVVDAIGGLSTYLTGIWASNELGN